MKHIYRYTFLLLFLCLMGTEQAIAQYNKHAVPCNAVRSDQGPVLLAGRRPMNISIGDCDFPDPPGGGDDDAGKDEDQPVNFEITFQNMQVLLQMDAVLAAVTERREREWLNKQEDHFRKEINRSFSKNFTSFKAAQEHFFEYYQRNMRRVNNEIGDIGNSHANKADEYDEQQKQYTVEMLDVGAWKGMKESCAPQGIIDCGDFGRKVIQGKRLENVQTDAAVDDLMDAVLADFSKKEVDAATELQIAQGVFDLRYNDKFLNEMVDNQMDHYEDQGLRTRVYLMTAYIVQYYNRFSGVLNIPTTPHELPLFWSSQSILEKGTQNLGLLEDEARIFEPLFFEKEAERCNYGTSPSSCFNQLERLSELRDRIIQEHIDEFVDYSEEGLNSRLNNIINGYTRANGGGKLGGLDELEYVNRIRDGDKLNYFYQLKNGGWAYTSQSPMAVNDRVSFSEPSINDSGLFYYIRNEDTGKWHELLMPAVGAPLSENPYLVDKFWDLMVGIARYATPIEDGIVLVDGKDFNGEEASQVQAGIFLVLGSVGGGVFKPVAKIGKGLYRTAKYAYVQGGKTIIKKFDDLLELGELLSKLRPGARYIDEGTGAHSAVKGHHPLSKIAFKSDEFYDANKAFSVSTDALGGQSVHNAITGNQNRLYSFWAKSGDRLTLEKMAEIEIQAMVDAGIPKDVATGWVIRALEDLERQGVKYITNIPWNKTN